jgi:hypothetical protein
VKLININVIWNYLRYSKKSPKGTFLGNSTNSFRIKMDVSKVKIGFEYSNEIQWYSTTQINYTNVSVSGWWILVVYGMVTKGQSVPQPVGAY